MKNEQVDSGSLNQICDIEARVDRIPLAKYLFVKMQNLRHLHHRLAARWLQRNGWVVFYLEEQARTCSKEDVCWLALYQQTRKRNE